MSKDKAGKKDKWKHIDLFEMMLNQSKVFRDMVEQFQKAWTPDAPTVTVSAAVTTGSPAKKPAKAAKTAPAAKPAKKASAKKAAASTKPAPAARKPSPRKSPGSAKPTRGELKQSKAVRKAAGK
jgi:hypothetical protein